MTLKEKLAASRQRLEGKFSRSPPPSEPENRVEPEPEEKSIEPILSPEEKRLLEEAELRDLQRRAAELDYALVPVNYGGSEAPSDVPNDGQNPPRKPPGEARVAPVEMSDAERKQIEREKFQEFVELLNTRFAKYRERLKHPTDKREQQWSAVCQAVFAYGELKENRQIIAPTGQGKSYFIACFLRIMADLYPTEWCPLHAGERTIPLVIEPAKNVLQTQKILASWRVMAQVCTLPALRASLGDTILNWQTIIINNQPVPYPFINMDVAPIALILDESQQVKNEDSVQSTIIESFAGHGVPVLPLSATPYSRVCQAKIIACILRPEFAFGAGKQRLSSKTWPDFARQCCPAGTAPEEWSPAALRRLQSFLEPYTIRWSIKYPHPVYTKYVGCRFATPWEEKTYRDADEEWQRVRMEMGKDPLHGQIRLLVAIRKFEQTSENLRAPHLVRTGFALWKEHETNPRKKKLAIVFGFAFATALDIAQAELEKLIANDPLAQRLKLAIIRGGRNCDNDHQEFQSDKRPLLLLTIACGGAGLSLDNNRFNKRQRYMLCSAVWNDIQMAQLAGRCQRLDTQTPAWMYILYYAGTVELQKLKKMSGKVRCLKEVTSKAPQEREEKLAKANNFVDGIDEIDYHEGGKLLALPSSEEEEETAANSIVGTAVELEFIHKEEEE